MAHGGGRAREGHVLRGLHEGRARRGRVAQKGGKGLRGGVRCVWLARKRVRASAPILRVLLGRGGVARGVRVLARRCTGACNTRGLRRMRVGVAVF